MPHRSNTYTLDTFLDFLWKQRLTLILLYITIMFLFGMHRLNFLILRTEALVICSQLVLNYRHALSHPPVDEKKSKEPTLLKENVVFGICTLMLYLSTTLLSIMHYVHFIGLVAYAFFLTAHYHYPESTPIYKEQFKNVAHIVIPGYINLPLGLYYGQCIDAWDASPCSIYNIISALDALLLVRSALYLLPYTGSIVHIFHSTIISAHILYYTLALLTLTLFIPQLIHLISSNSCEPYHMFSRDVQNLSHTTQPPISSSQVDHLTNTIQDNLCSGAANIIYAHPGLAAQAIGDVMLSPFR